MMSRKKMAARVHEINGTKPPASEWLTCHEATLFCGVGLSTFRSRIMPEVVCKRLGRRILVRRASLEAYMNSLEPHTVASQKKPPQRGKPRWRAVI
jgi:hypothetical protein